MSDLTVIPSEHEEQSMFFNIIRLRYPKDYYRVFAIANGSARDSDRRVAVIRGRRLREEGVTAGIPDIFCAIPTSQFHGLFLEMKRRKGGVVSKEQKEAMKDLSASGYKCEVARGFDEALEIFENYIRDRIDGF